MQITSRAPSNREFWLALLAILAITAIYIAGAIRLQKIPPASELFGHSIGILGFILMLATETLYTWRKRSHSARFGRISSWLQMHIFTGLVGPYMVLLHSSWKFNGLAGLIMLLTVLIVLSGFIGRYIYTAVPRNADGAILEAQAIQNEIGLMEQQIQQLTSRQQARQHKRQVRQLQRRQAKLRRQINSLATARRMLSVWHTVHVRMGLALFSGAFLHMLASIYYGELGW